MLAVCGQLGEKHTGKPWSRTRARPGKRRGRTGRRPRVHRPRRCRRLPDGRRTRPHLRHPDGRDPEVLGQELQGCARPGGLQDPRRLPRRSKWGITGTIQTMLRCVCGCTSLSLGSRQKMDPSIFSLLITYQCLSFPPPFVYSTYSARKQKDGGGPANRVPRGRAHGGGNVLRQRLLVRRAGQRSSKVLGLR